ncbi:MAG: DUF1127 domain-containing protein [Alphaproteobacteria bacterium]|nr:DUF1127 domain-containing protein [Alphaproteobacteria bacterium]
MQQRLLYLNPREDGKYRRRMENCMLTNTKHDGLKSVAQALPSFPSPVQVLARLANLLAVWERRARERKALAEMSNHMLNDLGISRVDGPVQNLSHI